MKHIRFKTIHSQIKGRVMKELVGVQVAAVGFGFSLGSRAAEVAITSTLPIISWVVIGEKVNFLCGNFDKGTVGAAPVCYPAEIWLKQQ